LRAEAASCMFWIRLLIRSLISDGLRFMELLLVL
jgi:hypothetical protein